MLATILNQHKSTVSSNDSSNHTIGQQIMPGMKNTISSNDSQNQSQNANLSDIYASVQPSQQAPLPPKDQRRNSKNNLKSIKNLSKLKALSPVTIPSTGTPSPPPPSRTPPPSGYEHSPLTSYNVKGRDRHGTAPGSGGGGGGSSGGSGASGGGSGGGSIGATVVGGVSGGGGGGGGAVVSPLPSSFDRFKSSPRIAPIKPPRNKPPPPLG